MEKRFSGFEYVEKMFVAPIVVLLSILLCIFQVTTSTGILALDTSWQRSFHLALISMITFLSIPMFSPKKVGSLAYGLGRFADLIMFVLSFLIAVFFYINFEYLFIRLPYVDMPRPLDVVTGVVAILLVIEITRRTSGLALVIVALVSLLYAYFGNYLPGVLHHSGNSITEISEHIFLLPAGIYGIPLSNAATIIFAFILFGAFLEKSGMNELFLDMACYATRNAKGGPAKVAIFGSALFGTISGSAVANVYGTGSMTIPMMKRVGYTPQFAGAVEAVASTGGQIMPPIMGAAAFIMADITGVGYLAVVKVALLPAILYYASLFFMIHFMAHKTNAGVIPPEMIPDVAKIFKQIYYLLSVVLLVVLMVIGRSPIYAALMATLSIFLMSLIRKETRMGPRVLIDTCVLAARNTLMISACCACAGIVIGVITITGLGFTFINFIASLAGDSRIILLLLITMVCVIMGMGVPTAPAYILVASLAAPLLIKSGFSMVASHLFVLYYACLSVITPPVCLASYAGAAIAKAPAMRTGWVAVQLGLVAFVIPYMFMFQPNLLMEGGRLEIAQAMATSFFGVMCVAAGVQGYMKTNMHLVERALFILGGFLLIDTGVVTDIAGLVILAGSTIFQFIKARRERPPVITTSRE